MPLNSSSFKGGSAASYGTGVFGNVGEQHAVGGEIGGNVIATNPIQCGGSRRRRRGRNGRKGTKACGSKRRTPKKSPYTRKRRGGGVLASGVVLPALFYTASEFIRRKSLKNGLSKLGLGPKK